MGGSRKPWEYVGTDCKDKGKCQGFYKDRFIKSRMLRTGF